MSATIHRLDDYRQPRHRLAESGGLLCGLCFAVPIGLAMWAAIFLFVARVLL